MENEFETKGVPEPIDFVGRSAAKAASVSGAAKSRGNVFRFPLPDNESVGNADCSKRRRKTEGV